MLLVATKSGIEAQYGGKIFALIIKSSLFERTFIDAKGVDCASLEIVHCGTLPHVTDLSLILFSHLGTYNYISIPTTILS